MWDTLSSYGGVIISAFIVFTSIIFIPEIRKSKKYWIGAIILISFQLAFDFYKINRDNNKENLTNGLLQNSNHKSDSLLGIITTMVADRKKDSIGDVDFRKDLEKKFNIIRDSITNKAVIKNITTNVKEVGTLNIY